MYRFLKTGFLFFLIFITGVVIMLVSISKSFEKNCLEQETVQETDF